MTKRIAQPTNKTTRPNSETIQTNPLRTGTIVDVRNRTYGGKEIIEGRATIVKAKTTDHYYEVRFHNDGHNMTYPRFVMPEHAVTLPNK